MRRVALAVFLAGTAAAADQAALDRGRKEEERSCVPCHSLRLVHSQRLSRAGWSRELDKMAGWGTKVSDRESLLEYLAATYGDDKPLPKAGMSEDGSSPQRRGGAEKK